MNQIHQETVLEVREAYLVDVVRHLANGLSAAESWETIREKSSGFADAFLRFGPGMPFSATRWGRCNSLSLLRSEPSPRS